MSANVRVLLMSIAALREVVPWYLTVRVILLPLFVNGVVSVA